jgi:hypothetical protein
LRHKTKDPSSVEDFGLEWGLAEGDTLTSSTWTVPAGITRNSDSFQASGQTTIWLSGGTDGAVYRLVNRITTSQGRTDERTLRVLVRDA